MTLSTRSTAFDCCLSTLPVKFQKDAFIGITFNQSQQRFGWSRNQYVVTLLDINKIAAPRYIGIQRSEQAIAASFIRRSLPSNLFTSIFWGLTWRAKIEIANLMPLKKTGLIATIGYTGWKHVSYPGSFMYIYVNSNLSSFIHIDAGSLSDHTDILPFS